MRCDLCRETISPVVSIDIDGTLGKYHDHFLQFLIGYYDRPFLSDWDGSGNWEDYLGLSREAYRDAKLAYRQGGWKRSMPMYSDADLLTDMMVKNGCDLWITTTRPYLRLDSVDPDTREWLRRNHIQFHHLLYDDNKYQRLATLVEPDRVAFVLEDLPDQYEQALDWFGEYKVWMVARPHNKNWRRAHPDTNVAGTLVSVMNVCLDRVQRWREDHD